DQRDFAHARFRQPLDLGDDVGDRPRDLRAARIGHDTEGTELVATFLYGDEGTNAARLDGGAARLFEDVELVLGRKLRIDDGLSARHAFELLGQPLVALRAD